jgi:hypothetical protein
MKRIKIGAGLVFARFSAFTQDTDKLFSESYPLHLKIQMSIKEIGTNKEKASYSSHQLYRQQDDGHLDSIKIGLKARGNYRLANCYFPPLWMKIPTKEAKGTSAEGHNKLKLVMPCYNTDESGNLIVKEYLCYKLFGCLTDFSFRARLVNIDLTELRRKKTKQFNIKGIIIEDIDKLAKRTNSKKVDEKGISVSWLNDTSALRFDLFQYLIANTDWSKHAEHNSKIVIHANRYIPIPYDFDLSGVVDAPYAFVSLVGGEELPIESVTERYYRGYCASKEITTFIRNEFLAKEDKLLKAPDDLKNELTEKEITSLKKYLLEFFDVLKSDELFNREIVDKCRVKGS